MVDPRVSNPALFADAWAAKQEAAKRAAAVARWAGAIKAVAVGGAILWLLWMLTGQ